MGEAERAATQRSLVLKGCSLQSQGPSEPCGEYPCVSMCVCVCVEAALGVRLPRCIVHEAGCLRVSVYHVQLDLPAVLSRYVCGVGQLRRVTVC